MSDERFVPPATRVPPTPYRRPTPLREDTLRLDGNEGNQPSQRLLHELGQADASILRNYPDTNELTREIARRYGVDPDRVVVTAGVDDALDRCCRAFLPPNRKIVMPVPTFEMLHRYVDIMGGTPVTVPWTDDYPTEEVIGRIDAETSLVAMITPNNPTGRAATREDLRRVAQAASQALVLLDHAYVEYADDDLSDIALAAENVVLLRTFSKAWGLAGCRVGFAIASRDVAAVLRSAGNPYAVSGLSLAVVRAQLVAGDDTLKDHVDRIRAERVRFTAHVTELGLSAAPSQANFLFVDFGPRVGFVYEALRRLGVLTRFFPHRPEIATGLRISLPGNEEHFQRLLNALDRCVAPQALFFDLDGVLADVALSYRQCIVETAKSFGCVVTRKDVERATMQGDANNDWVLTQRLLEEHGVTASLDDVVARYQALYLGANGRPGLRETERLLVEPELLERLARRLPLAIITGRPRQEAEWFLERYGIRAPFSEVICMEDGPVKPNPAPVRLAMERLAVERAWMIGDTPDDINAAAALGVVPIGVVAPGSDPAAVTEALTAAGATVVLDGAARIEELIT